MKQFLIDRFQEPTTWRGLVLLLTGLGVPLNPDLLEPIIATGLGLTGMIGVLSKDK